MPADPVARTRELVAGFIRSVVVIDDQPTRGLLTEEAPTLAAEPDVTLAELPALRAPERELDAKLDADGVARSFAMKGIVCGVIRPNKDSADDDAVVAAILSADVVILDWNIHGDDGDRAEALIRRVVEERSRDWLLVVIYTFYRREGLARIVERAAALLRADGMEPEVGEESVKRGGVAIQVVSKLWADENGAGGVPEIDLADRVVAHFAEGNEGLLRRVALRGLAVVRSEALAILREFDPVMDPAYIAHRLMLPNPGDAEGQLAAVLAGETEAALRARNAGGEAGIEAIKQWLQSKGITSEADVPKREWWDKVFQSGSLKGTRHEVLLRVLEHGADQEDPKLEFQDGKKAARGVTWLFAGKDESSAATSDARFAQLLELERDYSEDAPVLGLGTVLNDENRYLVCIQPACDSIRLPGPTSFPMVPLRPTGDEYFDVILEDSGTRKLVTPTKFSAVLAPTFKPNDQGLVLAAGGPGSWLFEDEGATPKQYRYIATLREHQALRLARRFAERLARLGLDESEWARRHAPKDRSDD